MAITDTKKYTVQEKLNKMDVDLIDVTVAPDVDNAGANAAGDLLWKPTEIPNAVAVNGGTAILQSCCAIISPMVTGAFDIVIASNTTTFVGDSSATDSSATETGDTVAAIENTLAVMDGTCGFFSITNAFDAGVVAIGDKKNIGLVCKAESDSRSLYVWGIVQNTTDYNEGDIVLRFGFVKD